MEVDIGGLGKQIEELVEAIALPVEQADKFKTLEFKLPKGCLIYEPSGKSTCVTCYFPLLIQSKDEIIRSKVPQLVEKEKTYDGVQGEPDLTGRIV